MPWLALCGRCCRLDMLVNRSGCTLPAAGLILNPYMVVPVVMLGAGAPLGVLKSVGGPKSDAAAELAPFCAGPACHISTPSAYTRV